MTKGERRAVQLVGYLHVSSLDQKELRQIEGIALDKRFVNKGSGNDLHRPGLGFVVPDAHRKKYEVSSSSIGTDTGLTLATRRGTGYYKVPSLRGIWYRNMFALSGWCATLDDWVDPRRLESSYVPTGDKPLGGCSYPVKGHEFGLDLSATEKKELIAFLETL